MASNEAMRSRWARRLMSLISNEGTARQAVFFILVGALNTAFGYSVYAAGYLAGLSPSLALLIASCLGMAFNFITIGSVVFGSLRLKALPTFVAIYIIIYLVNVSGL